MKNIKTLISFGISSMILTAPVLADNCGSYTDCFFTAQAATNVSIALSLGLIAISLLLDFTPVVGTVKGIIESFAGKDIITGTELSTFDRMIGILPFVGGVREITKVEKGIKAVEEISKIEKGVAKLEKVEQEAGKIQKAIKSEEELRKQYKSAYNLADEYGKHHGMIEEYSKRGRDEIEKSIRTFSKRISQHEEKIVNPIPNLKKLNNPSLEVIERYTKNYWPKEINKFQQQVKILKEMLK